MEDNYRVKDNYEVIREYVLNTTLSMGASQLINIQCCWPSNG